MIKHATESKQNSKPKTDQKHVSNSCKRHPKKAPQQIIHTQNKKTKTTPPKKERTDAKQQTTTHSKQEHTTNTNNTKQTNTITSKHNQHTKKQMFCLGEKQE